MGRSSGLGGIIEGVTGKGGTLTGRGRGIPMPMFPTENVGMMSGSIRKKRTGRRGQRPDHGRPVAGSPRGSRRGVRGGLMQVTKRDPKTGQMYGGLVKDGVPQFKAPDGSTPPPFPRRPEFDPSKPSAVMETERVNVQDPTLGGPPEREVPMPKERDTSPRGPAPFSPDERAMARDAFFEKMFSRADERKQSKAMDQEERGNVRDARRDEAAMRGSERGRGIADRVGQENRRGNRNRRGRRMRRRDFTRKRSRMEGRRSREERAAFRDRFVSTLR